MWNIKRLKQVQKYLSEIPNINRGGCGISALSMYRWIKDNERIGNTKFVFLYIGDEGKERYLNNQKILRDKDKKAQACSHICILYMGEFIDSDGEVDVSDYDWIQIIDEEEFIKRALSNTKDWNILFNREYINNIENELEIDLGDIN